MADETFTGYVRAMRIHVLVLRDCTTFVPIGYADMLRKSAALAATLPLPRPPPEVQVTLVSAGKTREVMGIGGIRIVCDAALAEVRKSDLVLVPAVDPDVLAHLELNRAVALSKASGAAAALELVDRLREEPTLRAYHLLPSIRGDLLGKLGRFEEARAEFERAASMTRNAREHNVLLERARACGDGTV